MLTIRMAGLSRTHTGRYVGRKVIPPDVRQEYARRFGPRREAKFSLPSTTDEAKAKEDLAKDNQLARALELLKSWELLSTIKRTNPNP